MNYPHPEHNVLRLIARSMDCVHILHYYLLSRVPAYLVEIFDGSYSLFQDPMRVIPLFIAKSK